MEQQQQLLETLVSNLDLGNDVPEFVYHYTSPGALLRIISEPKPKIWATDIRYLNDAQEFEYTVDLTTKLLDDLKSDAVGKEDAQIILECQNALTFAPNYPLYAASFSGKGDLLSQWRAYCPASGGVSIGFSSKALNQSSGTILCHCLYDLTQQKELLRQMIDSVLTTWRPQLNNGQLKNEVSLGTDFLSLLLVLAAIYKHPGFDEEDEWRLTRRSNASDPFQPLFREGRSGIVPYTEFSLCDGTTSSIDRVVVGPNPHQELALHAVDSLLQTSNVSHVPVFRSDIPYRTR